MRRNTSPMDLHSALSALLFAVNEEINPWGRARIIYDNNLYLQVEIETRFKHRQRVADILMHGVLWGPYQYHFNGVAIPLGYEDDDWITLTALVDLHRSKPPSGPIDFNNTPSQLREKQQRYEWGYR